MDTPELRTDGNAFAGVLQEVFVTEMTSVRHVCDGCGEEHAVGEHLSYTGAGKVLRCPGCGAVAAVVSDQPGQLVMGMSGTWRMPR
jgi:Family of unknown function (DUF6510)